MTLPLWIGLLVCVLAVAAVGLTAFGSKRWTGRMATLTRGLEAARIGGTGKPPYPTHYDPHELEGLPPPVQRYFRAVLKDGQPMVSAVAHFPGLLGPMLAAITVTTVIGGRKALRALFGRMLRLGGMVMVFVAAIVTLVWGPATLARYRND